jgi:hypothetical protein
MGVTGSTASAVGLNDYALDTVDPRLVWYLFSQFHETIEVPNRCSLIAEGEHQHRCCHGVYFSLITSNECVIARHDITLTDL